MPQQSAALSIIREEVPPPAPIAARRLAIKLLGSASTIAIAVYIDQIPGSAGPIRLT